MQIQAQPEAALAHLRHRVPVHLWGSKLKSLKSLFEKQLTWETAGCSGVQIRECAVLTVMLGWVSKQRVNMFAMIAHAPS